MVQGGVDAVDTNCVDGGLPEIFNISSAGVRNGQGVNESGGLQKSIVCGFNDLACRSSASGAGPQSVLTYPVLGTQFP